jgi:hypothetical protein
MLRYRGARNWQLRRKIANRHRSRGEHQHDRPARPIAEGRPDISLSVSDH